MKEEWRPAFRFGICAFLLYLAITYWPNAGRFLAALFHSAAPLAVGCVIAYLLNILASFYEKHYFVKSRSPVIAKSRRPVCVAAAIITLAAIVVFIVALVIPQLIDCVQLLAADLQALVAALPAQLERFDVLPNNLLPALSGVNWQEKLGKAIGLLTNGLGSAMDTVLTVLSSVFSSIVTAFISVVFAIYLLMGKERLGRQFDRLVTRYLKASRQGKLRHVLSVTNDCFRRYIIGQCTEAVILGVLCILGMMILRLPYAVMIGTLIGFTALIPIAGAYIGAGVGALMIFMIAPMQAVVFLIFIVVLQQLEGNLIYPKVVGSSIGLPASWVFAAITVGGGIMGVMGMVLAVPLTAVFYQLLREDIYRGDVRSIQYVKNDLSESQQPKDDPQNR